MSERILVCVAWPYANGYLHLGHVAGAYLPADIFARYHRLKGNQVVMVSGSDQHGTPVTIRAEQEGLRPEQVVEKYHREFLRAWEQLGISFDLFTTTGTENHKQVAHDFFRTLLGKGYLYKAIMPQLFCPTCSRFLPDRYVEGTCPHCGNPKARGDQCDVCGRTLDPEDLINPRCRICGTTPEVRESEHFFLRLSAFQEPLLEWVRRQDHWRASVQNQTIGMLQEGLKDRAITRDIDWGITVPVPGYESKRIYVWFEAVMGYFSATKEWAQRQGRPEAWRDFWQDPSCRSYYFIGKDNITFHTIIWPAILMGYGGLNLPYDVPANEFLTLEGGKYSKSQNWAIWVPDYLSRYEPDPLRYYLSANMPETSDSDFSWRDFYRRNNDELVATYGNLVHRVLSFTYRSFQGQVPQPGPLDAADQALLDRAEATLREVANRLEVCRFREAVQSWMGLAQEANRYVDAKAPWRTIRIDRQVAATTLWVCINVISALKTATCPFLPFSARKLHQYLGFPGEPERAGWAFEWVQGGQRLAEPAPLFNKLDERGVEEENQRLASRAG